MLDLHGVRRQGDGFSPCIPTFWAVVVDAGVVALLLAVRAAAALPVFVANFGLMRGVNNFRPAPRSRARAAAGSGSRSSGAAPMPALPV